MKRILGLKDQEGDSLLVAFASAERPFHSSSKSWPWTVRPFFLSETAQGGQWWYHLCIKEHRTALKGLANFLYMAR